VIGGAVFALTRGNDGDPPAPPPAGVSEASGSGSAQSDPGSGGGSASESGPGGGLKSQLDPSPGPYRLEVAEELDLRLDPQGPPPDPFAVVFEGIGARDAYLTQYAGPGAATDHYVSNYETTADAISAQKELVDFLTSNDPDLEVTREEPTERNDPSAGDFSVLEGGSEAVIVWSFNEYTSIIAAHSVKDAFGLYNALPY
jgi:hypothetical protein